MDAIQILLKVTAAYMGCGLLFAIAFVSKGVEKTDEGAHGCSLGFRIIIIPGTIVLWPLLLRKWINAVKKAK